MASDNNNIKGWAGLIGGGHSLDEEQNPEERQVPTHETIHKSNYTPPKLSPEEFYQRQAKDEQNAVDAEQALHDNFEKLMKEQEKQDRNQGLKL